jgi:hypothetical protein
MFDTVLKACNKCHGLGSENCPGEAHWNEMSPDARKLLSSEYDNIFNLSTGRPAYIPGGKGQWERLVKTEVMIRKNLQPVCPPVPLETEDRFSIKNTGPSTRSKTKRRHLGVSFVRH